MSFIEKPKGRSGMISDILEPFDCFRHFCSLARCAMQNVSWWIVFCVLFAAEGLRLLHDFVLHLLQHQWADAKSNTTRLWGFAWLTNSRNGCRRGACCRRQRLQNCNSSHAVMVSCLTWFPWTPPPRPQRSHVRQPRVPPRNVRHSSDPWEEKSNLLFWREKNRDFETKGVDQVPPGGTTTGIGRKRELRERDGSHKRSRNYSRKLRERTPLPPSVRFLAVIGAQAVWI